MNQDKEKATKDQGITLKVLATKIQILDDEKVLINDPELSELLKKRAEQLNGDAEGIILNFGGGG